jgi:hypothetical protein
MKPLTVSAYLSGATSSTARLAVSGSLMRLNAASSTMMPGKIDRTP